MTTHQAQIILYTVCILYIFCTVSYYICAIKKKIMKVPPLHWLFKFSISHIKVFSLIICMTVQPTFLELLKINTKTLLVKYIIWSHYWYENKWLNLSKSILLYWYRKKKAISFMLNYKISLKYVTKIETLKDTIYRS